MKRYLILCFIALLAMGNTASAQGLLKKLQKGVEKIDNALGGKKNTNAGNNTQRNNDAADDDDADDDAPKERFPYNGPKSNFYDIKDHLRNTNQMGKAFSEKFGTFKTTAATKVINVDDLKFIKLGYFDCNRAFVQTNKNGAYCIDTKGNIVKQWEGGNILRFFAPNFKSIFPKFGSNRFIDIAAENNSNTAVIYDQDFKVIKKIPNVVYVSDYQDGVAYVVYEVKSGVRMVINRMYIDINGNQIFKNLTDDVNKELIPTVKTSELDMRPTCDGLVAFCTPVKNGYSVDYKWGFRDASGKIVIPAKYDQVQDFSNGLAAVATGTLSRAKWGFIDKTGNMVIEQKFTIQPSQFDQCGLAMVQNKEKESMFIDKTGQVVSEKYKNCITPFFGGHAVWTKHEVDNETVSEHDRTFLIDSKFNIVTALYNDRLFRYPNSHGMELFGQNGAGGIDYDLQRYATEYPKTFIRDGTLYFEVPYARFGAVLSDGGDIKLSGITGAFTEGLAPVANDKEAGYVNMQGEWVIKFEENEF